MSAAVEVCLSSFARDVDAGLSDPVQKYLPARCFYDALGSTLFEAITLLPEYGLTRADERLLRKHGGDIARMVGSASLVAELGSGTGKKTRNVLAALSRQTGEVQYLPIDISAASLAYCEKELSNVARVLPVCADWFDGLSEIARTRAPSTRLLVLFLGSSIGNVDRNDITDFLASAHARMRSGDFLLIGADLIKDTERMIAAYDDETGVTAAFNLNVLSRINHELAGNFALRSFAHEARWNESMRRIEMHLMATRPQSICIGALNRTIHMREGETIWTESSHKFTVPELDDYARASGFAPVKTWVDREWPFAEALWEA